MGKEKFCRGKDGAKMTDTRGALLIFALTPFRSIKVLYTRKRCEAKVTPKYAAEKPKFNT